MRKVRLKKKLLSPQPESQSAGVALQAAGVATRDFVRVEKNLGTIGFFTPSKSRSQGDLREKVVRFKREIGGKTIVAEAAIIPSVTLGLPTTADQDKYLAFQKIVNERRAQLGGEISNPVSFTSSELLAILGLGQAGKNYNDVYEWLERMAATTIRSQGVVFLAKRKVYARDIFHVFDRVVIMGGELPDGHVADCNYVWLSTWQLENINQNYLLPVDFETYRGLKNNIAKALVPLLQLWLYASRNHGVFEKRYDDLCELLALRPQKYPSDITKQVGPSLDELRSKGFLSAWALEVTNDGRSYKITASHGPKFFADQRSQSAQVLTVLEVDESPKIVHALVSRDVLETQAIKLLKMLPANQPVMDQIDYIDSIVQRGRIENPPGFYVSMLRENIPVPDNFGTTSRLRASEAREKQLFDKQVLIFERESRYEEYVRAELNRHITEVVGLCQFELLVKTKMPECRSKYPLIPAATLGEIAESSVRSELRDSLQVMSFQNFCRGAEQPKLF